MKDKIKVPEILAPAGSMESLKAAVAAGCDAIYIGGSRFGARAYADNPEKDEMLSAIEYCHLQRIMPEMPAWVQAELPGGCD